MFKFWKKKNEEKVGGYIAHYGLQDWWLNTFSPQERKYIDRRFEPMEGIPHMLTRGQRSSSKPPAQFLNELSTWFRRKEDTSIAGRIHAKVVELGKEAYATDPTPKPEYVEGRHVANYVDDIKELKRQGNLDEAEKILLEIVDTETDAPWYYEQLAIIYRKQKDYDKEVAILEQFAKQEYAPGAKPQKLKERLEKAKELQQKAKSKAKK